MTKGGKLEDWKVEKLGDVCEVNPRRPVIDRPDTKPTTFVPMSAVDDVHGVVARPEQRLFASVKKGYTFFTENDVIFAKITPCMENGKQAIARNLADGIGFGSTEFHVIRPNEKIMAEWIWYFVRQPIVLENATKFFTGTVGQQRVPDIYLKSLEIPIPPLPEQQRIVSVLDEAFAFIAQAESNAERNLVNARELFESVLESFFEDPQHTPDGKELASLCELIVDCEHKTAPIQDEGYPSIRTPNIGRGYLILDGVNRVSEETYTRWTRRAIPQGGDLILAREAPAGNVAVIPDGLEVCLGQRTVLIRPNNKIFNSQYLMWLLLSGNVQKFFLQNSKGSTVVHVNMKDIRGLKINNIPPLAEQRAIVGRLEALSAETGRLEEIYQQKVESLEELKKSMLGKAFEGEL